MKNALSIFAIDDDAVTRFIHKKAVESLTDYNIIFDEAINGDEGMKKIKNLIINGQKLPDIILLDLNMPVMDGFEFLNQFKLLTGPNCKTETLVVSSSDNCSEIQVCYKLGISKFLTKPVSRLALHDIIKERLSMVPIY